MAEMKEYSEEKWSIRMTFPSWENDVILADLANMVCYCLPLSALPSVTCEMAGLHVHMLLSPAS